jgi:hypothetical protein
LIGHAADDLSFNVSSRYEDVKSELSGPSKLVVDTVMSDVFSHITTIYAAVKFCFEPIVRKERIGPLQMR